MPVCQFQHFPGIVKIISESGWLVNKPPEMINKYFIILSDFDELE
jgi:hypothetical protein